jgi:hypothetical protein
LQHGRVDGQRTGCGGDTHAADRDQEQLDQPEQADAEDLAGEQDPRRDRGEQQLHDPAGLLLDHAEGHPEAVPE